MYFKNWIINEESKINFAGFWKDGTIIVYIDGKKYVYVTDAIYHDKWKRMVNFSPFKVLNQIKSQVEDGSASLIEQS